MRDIEELVCGNYGCDSTSPVALYRIEEGNGEVIYKSVPRCKECTTSLSALLCRFILIENDEIRGIIV